MERRLPSLLCGLCVSLYYFKVEASVVFVRVEIGTYQEELAAIHRVAARVVPLLELLHCLTHAFVVFEFEYVDVA